MSAAGWAVSVLAGAAIAIWSFNIGSMMYTVISAESCEEDNMELSVERVNVDLEMGTVIITGYDTMDVIRQIGARELLADMDYQEIKEFVAEQDAERAEIEAMSREDR